MKVSAVVCNRDELFLEESLKSIDGLVDEIVLVDASKNQPDFDKLKKMITKSDFDYVHTIAHIGKQLDMGFSLATNDLIFRWDSDFVGDKNISLLFNFLHRLKNDKYAIYTEVRNINLNGFMGYHKECYIVTRTDHIMNKNRLRRRFVCLTKDLIGSPHPRFTFFPIPFNYKIKTFDECVINHLNIKKHSRDFERPYQVYWQLIPENERKKYGSLEQYAKNMVEMGGEGFDWKFKKLPY